MFYLNSFDFLWLNFLLWIGQLNALHSSENSHTHAEPVSKMTSIFYEGLPNQNDPS